MTVDENKDFDVVRLWEAMEAERKTRGLSWSEVMAEIDAASSVLAARLGSKNHPMSASTVKNMVKRGSISCQHALGMLRWLGQPPEHFVPHEASRPNVPLPKAGADRRLRWDIWAMADLLDAGRRSRGLTWKQLAQELGCSPTQISSLRRLRYGISIQLAMRIARWLGRPAADFIVATESLDLLRSRAGR
jgi:ribosome-binding protein aMBF1 (putative translation factor)